MYVRPSFVYIHVVSGTTAATAATATNACLPKVERLRRITATVVKIQTANAHRARDIVCRVTCIQNTILCTTEHYAAEKPAKYNIIIIMY